MENWRDIPGYEGRYLVSSQGQVRSLLTNKILRAVVEATGYVSVCLKDARGGQRTHLVHLLVLRAFIGLRPADQETRHLNGIRTDNRLVENLRYGTRVENRADRARHGHDGKGADNPNVKLSTDAVAAIRRQFAERGYKRGAYTRLAEQYGVTSRQISYIVKNQSWLH
jgi:hypothetical protein